MMIGSESFNGAVEGGDEVEADGAGVDDTGVDREAAVAAARFDPPDARFEDVTAAVVGAATGGEEVPLAAALLARFFLVLTDGAVSFLFELTPAVSESIAELCAGMTCCDRIGRDESTDVVGGGGC